MKINAQIFAILLTRYINFTRKKKKKKKKRSRRLGNACRVKRQAVNHSLTRPIKMLVAVVGPFWMGVSVTTPCGIVLIAAADADYCSTGLILSSVRTWTKCVQSTTNDRFSTIATPLRSKNCGKLGCGDAYVPAVSTVTRFTVITCD